MIAKFRENPIEILLIEDNSGDARLTMEAMMYAKARVKLRWVKDGEEAIEYLRRKGKYAEAITPALIFLDLNLPKKDGREVLSEIKQDPSLKHIPVIILTISSSEDDIIKAYSLHANCYIVKPIDLNQFISIVNSLEDFWFTKVTLPPS